MAIIKCSECGKEISDKASSCPHCGCPMEDIIAAKHIEDDNKELNDSNSQVEEEKKQPLTPEQIQKRNKTICIIGVVAVVAFIIVFIFGYKIPRDKAYKKYLVISDNYNNEINSYNKVAVLYNEKVNQIIEGNDKLTVCIDEAQKIIDDGEEPYDTEVLTTLNNTIKTMRNGAVETPNLIDEKELDDGVDTLKYSMAFKINKERKKLEKDIPIVSTETAELSKMNDELIVPDYPIIIAEIEDEAEALKNSYEIQKQVTNPTEKWVLSKLESVENIANIACATEENDPNEKLGKDGGYTAQIYFSSALLGTQAKTGDSLIAAGTDAGGSIEVYRTVEDAEKRNSYLSSFDGTIFDSGKHRVVGTMVVRVSAKLNATKQENFMTEIIDALIAL